MDYFKNDSDALVKTDKIINNLSAEQFRSYMNEINSGRKDAYLDFIKEVKKSEINSTQTEPEIKQGVRELFESNPELVSEVYEVLGFGKDSNYYEGNINPEPNTIFVFGSNTEGRHGAGAAKVAREQFGAVYGQGEGLQGNAYALPTKDLRVKENKGFKSISPEQITNSIKKLYETAKQNPNKQFKVAYRNTTDTSLNGYTGLEMIEMFNQAGTIPSNVIFSKEWVNTNKLNTQLPISPEQKQKAQELYSQQSPITSPSLTSKIEEVKKAYLDFSYQTRLDRVSMLTNMFSDKVTELLEQESPEGTYTLEELQENPDLANKLKYKANPSKRKDIIALQNLDDNNVFNLVKKDLIAFINTSEEDLKVQEFGRFKNISLYSDLTPIETDHILPHFIQAKKREYQKVLDN